MPGRWLVFSICGGLTLAAVITLSPLIISVTILAAVVIARAGSGLPDPERKLVTTIVIAGLLVRVGVVGGLVLAGAPKHESQSLGLFLSGDERYGFERALRTRDVVLGTAASKYDYFVASDAYGRNSYISLLTVVQTLVGPTPYSMRLLNSVLFLAGALLLFRMSRRAFGLLPAHLGLFTVLFYPTLFVWSISLLKEALYFIGSVGVLAGGVHLVRGPSWHTRAYGSLGLVAGLVTIAGLRQAATALALGGLGLGLVGYVVTISRRTFRLSIVVAAIGATLVLSRPSVHLRIAQTVGELARTHSGHVFTVGHAYKLLDEGFYLLPRSPSSEMPPLTPGQRARFLLRGLVSFIVVPVPWQLVSMRELVYLPEQMAWYLLVVLLPIGIAIGQRRDRLVTCLLAGYIVPTAAVLAFTNGNVGTLVRLRGLVIPYMMWLSAVGFCGVLEALASRRRQPAGVRLSELQGVAR